MGLLSVEYDFPCPKCGYKYEHEEQFEQLPIRFPAIHIDLDVRDPKNIKSIRRDDEKTV